ncbi:hypothetical protein NA57DRAFT_35669 [Rhizodiscina lignyota]|uniref:PHD-type domain-containing protein n=1 Tax=Rhizodiscina lignyota TaxID=1504668 RepID=A0A9P4IGD2_9PEZI|nr:hypothetical protein NA57DRAFT_35669 [Rhizodiscina lignyota]
MQQPLSSSLHQYHHGSKSPEEQRRESISYPPDVGTTLPPIKHLASFGDRPAPTPLTTDLSPQRNDRSPFTPQIKDEPAATPRTSPPHKSPPANVDPDTAKAIAAAANEHGTRGVRAAKPTIEIPEPDTPAPAVMKRPAPAKVMTKKGVARKPPAKKRKVEDENDLLRRSGTPVSRTTSKTPAVSMRGGSAAPKKSESNTPQLGSSPAPNDASSPAAEEFEEDGEEGSDNEVYCVCRKPDNHSWMIACDGGCDDWFHGKCVKMREDMGELIDKYICPNCTRDGRGVTTWKPGCRRQGCNKPARINADPKKSSKYCSDECAKQFFSEKLGLDSAKAKEKARRKANGTDNAGNEMEIDDEDDFGPRLGPLRPGEVKAMVDAAKNLDEFRKLGENILSPPATASPDKTSFASEIPAPQPPSFTLTPSENLRIQAISNEKDKLTLRRALLRDREQFTKLVVDQATKYAEKEGLKPKDVCGYDSRLAWSEPEFAKWRDSRQGKAALKAQSLDATTTDGEAEANGDIGKGNFCARKRCEQHKQWAKISSMDVRAELSDLQADRAKLEEEEKEIRQRANLRWRAENSSKGNGGEAQRLEGWVEVVDG